MGWRQHMQETRKSQRARPHMLFHVPGILLMFVIVGLGFDTFSEPSAVKRLLISFLMGSLIVDVGWLIRQSRRVRLVEAWSERTRAHETAQISVQLYNASASDILIRLALDSRGQPSQWTWAPPQQNATVNLRSAQQLTRGAHTFPDILCELQSPLRLFCARWVPRHVLEDGFVEEILVWPAPWNKTIPTLHTEDDEGGFHEPRALVAHTSQSEAVGRTQNTPGAHGWLREWRRGDRLAHIAHKASAHRDVLLVQTSSFKFEENRTDLLLTLNWALSVTDGDREQALSLLATASERGLAQGRRVGLQLEHTTVPTARGEHHRRQLLDALARVPVVAS
jgi:uncharacterized protein (DUF58 family)